MAQDSTIRRREFIAGTTALATGTVLASEKLASGANSFDSLKPADFAQLVGQSFAVDGTSEHGTRQRGTLVLQAVVAADKAKAGDRPSHLRGEAFSLQFSAQDVALDTGTHKLAGGPLSGQGVYLHEMLDQRAPGQRHYEAVFN